MKSGRISKKEAMNIHSEVAEVIRMYFVRNGYNIQSADNKGYDFKVDGKRCKVNAHKNINDGIVIEYATSKHTILDAGYDMILYMDVTNNNRNSFYMVSVKTIANAISNHFGKSKYYFQISRRDVLLNDGLCIGIHKDVFENIDGVELFEF